MKQGTYNHLAVVFDGIDAANISRIEFVFSQTVDGAPLKENLYRASGSPTGDVSYSNGVFLVPFSQDDTYLFKPGTLFYMDTRIHPFGNYFGDNPRTPIVPLRMEPTLFYTIDHVEEAEA